MLNNIIMFSSSAFTSVTSVLYHRALPSEIRVPRWERAQEPGTKTFRHAHLRGWFSEITQEKQLHDVACLLDYLLTWFASQQFKHLLILQKTARDERRMFEKYDVCVCVMTICKIVILHNTVYVNITCTHIHIYILYIHTCVYIYAYIYA